MKNTILKYLATTLGLMLLTSSLAHAAEAPNFEFFNKSKSNLSIIVQIFVEKTGDGGKQYAVAPGKKLVLKDSPDRILKANIVELSIINSDKPTMERETMYYKIENAANKTKYVSFNPDKSATDPSKWLYPQTGKYFGILGTSDSGYSLRNNIKADNIRMEK